MHPATKMHIYGMIEVVRQSLKSIEAAMAVAEVSGDTERPVKHAVPQVPIGPDYLSEQEEDEVGRMFGLIAGQEDPADGAQ